MAPCDFQKRRFRLSFGKTDITEGPVRQLILLFLILPVLLLSGCKYETYSLDDDLETGLPRLVVETKEPILTKTDYAKAQMGYYESSSSTDNIFGGAGDSLLDNCKIRFRGNTTNAGTKRPYNIKIDKKTKAGDIFSDVTYTYDADWNTVDAGGIKIKKLSLLANALEPTMLHNDICFAIMGNDIGAGQPTLPFQWTVNHEFVDLYINSEFKGTYMLTDRTSNIPKYLSFDEEHATSGFLLSIDGHYDEDPKFRTSAYNLPAMIKWPAYDDFDPELDDSAYSVIVSRITDELNEKETVLQSGSWSDIESEFDIDSFAKFWILVNLAGYSEPEVPLSVFFYEIEQDGKLYCGPGWDFDMWTLLEPENDLYLTDSWYYRTLLSHDEFKKVIKDYWKQLRLNGTISNRYENEAGFTETSGTPSEDEYLFADYIASYARKMGNHIQKSWNANGKVYDNRISFLNGQFQTLSGHVYAICEYFYDRAEHIDPLIEAL